MNVALAVEMDVDIERLSGGIERMAMKLRQFFVGKSYGASVSNVFIGLILMGVDSERLHPVRPVRYARHTKFKSRITGRYIELENAVEFDVKPDHERLKSLSSEEAEKYIVENLIAGARQLEEKPDLFPDFDARMFKSDLAACLSLGNSPSD